MPNKIHSDLTSGQQKSWNFFLFFFLASCLLLPASYAATIQGKVFVEGSVPANPEINMDADPVCKAAYTETVHAQVN